MTVLLNLERLRRELLLRGWSWQTLCTEANISRSTASQVAAGYEVSEATLGRIARALEASPAPALASELIA